jgi:hypothetical protein
VIYGGYASGMWKFKILYCGFLLDVLKGLVHFEGFCNRLASFWTETVVKNAAQWPKTAQTINEKE